MSAHSMPREYKPDAEDPYRKQVSYGVHLNKLHDALVAQLSHRQSLQQQQLL